MEGWCFGCCCVTTVKYDADDGTHLWERTRPSTVNLTTGLQQSLDSKVMIDDSNGRYYTQGYGASPDGDGLERWDSLTDPVKDWDSADPGGPEIMRPGPSMAIGTDGHIWGFNPLWLWRLDVSDGSTLNDRETSRDEGTFDRIFQAPDGDAYVVSVNQARTYGSIRRLDKDDTTAPDLDYSHIYTTTGSDPLNDGYLVGSNMIAARRTTNSSTLRYDKLGTDLTSSATYDAATAGESAADQKFDAGWIRALNSTSFIGRETRAASPGARWAKYSIAGMTQDWTNNSSMIGSAEWERQRFATDGTNFYCAEHEPSLLPDTIHVQKRSGSDGSLTWETQLDTYDDGTPQIYCSWIEATTSYLIVLGSFCVNGSVASVVCLDASDGSLVWDDYWSNSSLVGFADAAPLHAQDAGSDTVIVVGPCSTFPTEACTTTAPPSTTYATTTTQPPTTTYGSTTTSGSTTTAWTTPTGDDGCTTGGPCVFVWDGSTWNQITDPCIVPPAGCDCDPPVNPGRFVGQSASRPCGIAEY